MLEIAYAGNVLIVTPILLVLWFHEDGSEIIFGGAFAVSGGLRILIASMWTAIVACSLAGLEWERTFVALLVFQIAYKVLFLGIYALPRALRGRWDEIPTLLCAVFLLGAVFFPLLILLEYGS